MTLESQPCTRIFHHMQWLLWIPCGCVLGKTSKLSLLLNEIHNESTSSVRNSTTLSNKSLLLQLVTWLLHVTNFSNVKHTWTFVFKLRNALKEIVEKIFESFFHHKNFINFNSVYFFTKKMEGQIKKNIGKVSILRIKLLFLITMKILHNNVTYFSNE